MELNVDSALTDQCTELFVRRHGAFEVSFHSSFVDFHGQLDELFTVFFSLITQICRNFANGRCCANGAVPGQSLHFNKIDNAFELIFSADWQLNWKSDCAKTRANHFYATVEIGTNLVHLIDEDHTWNMVLLSLTPNSFSLRLYASIRIEKSDCAVENAERTLNFDGEVNVARRVDDVEATLLAILTLPERGRCSRGNRDTTFLLLLHPVHGGSTVMGFTNLVVLTGIEQDTLGHRRLTGVDVSHNTEIAVVFDFIFAGHVFAL